MRIWSKKNKESIKKSKKKYRATHKKEIAEKAYLYNLKYLKVRPWYKTLMRITTRCSGKNEPYYKKGIKNFLKLSDLKFLWFRDKASLLKKASIDRINPELDYTLENCRYIELSENSRRTRRNKAITKIKERYMNNKDLLKKLSDLRACREAVKWTNGMNLKTAWNKCKRADWLIWFICKMEIGTKQERIHAVCDCAATALMYVPKGEDRPRLAIEAARKYTDNPTEENRQACDRAIWAAWAARATTMATWAAEAAGAAAEAATHQQMCDMIRAKIRLPTDIVKK